MPLTAQQERSIAIALGDDFNGAQKKAIVVALGQVLDAGVVAAATTSTNGTVKQAATVAAAAVPFADLTAAANKVNEILTAVKAAGQMA